MALTLNRNPNQHQLSRNPIWAKLTTDILVDTAAVKAKIWLEVTDVTVTQSQTITMPFADRTIVFTFFDVSLNGSGISLRTPGALNLANFILQLAQDFATNYHIATNYDITTNSGNVIFEAKEAGSAYSFLAPSDTANAIAFGTNVAGVDEEQKPNFRIALDVYMEQTYGSGTYTKIHGKEQIPVNLACLFNIQDAIHRYMGSDLPAYGLAAITLCTGILRRYKIRYAEKFGTDPDYVIATLSDVCYVLKGGVNFIENGYEPAFLTGYTLSNQKFITAQPRTKTVVATQPEYLYFFVPTSTTTVNLQAKIYYTDGTTLTVTALTKATTEAYQLYIIPVGYTQIIAPSATKAVSKYQVWVENQSAAVKSEVFTYKLSSKTEVDEHFFLFESSLGAFETLRTTGEHTKAISTEATIAQRITEVGYTNSDGETEKFDVTGNNTFLQSTGYKTKDEIEWLEDLLYSKKVIEIVNGEYIPVIINTAGITKYKTRDNLFAYTFEYTHAFNNKAPKGNVPAP